MPELPEVETIRRDLSSALLRRTVQSIQVKDPFVLTGIGPNGKPRRRVKTAEFEKQILGKRIESFDRRAKYLAMVFSDSTALVFHLRMTGQMLLEAPKYSERIRFDFDGEKSLYFADRRRFGEVVFSEDWEKEPEIAALGVEATHRDLSGEYLRTAFRGRSAPVHSILLSQKYVSGLGNIYVTEALFAAGIRPTKPCGRIADDKLEALSKSIRQVISQSIEHRGYSMSTYVDALGKKGRSQLFSKAYGKEGLPCPRCKTLFKRVVLGGRGVVFCKSCQR